MSYYNINFLTSSYFRTVFNDSQFGIRAKVGASQKVYIIIAHVFADEATDIFGRLSAGVCAVSRRIFIV